MSAKLWYERVKKDEIYQEINRGLQLLLFEAHTS